MLRNALSRLRDARLRCLAAMDRAPRMPQGQEASCPSHDCGSPPERGAEPPRSENEPRRSRAGDLHASPVSVIVGMRRPLGCALAKHGLPQHRAPRPLAKRALDPGSGTQWQMGDAAHNGGRTHRSAPTGTDLARNSRQDCPLSHPSWERGALRSAGSSAGAASHQRRSGAKEGGVRARTVASGHRAEPLPSPSGVRASRSPCRLTHRIAASGQPITTPTL